MRGDGAEGLEACAVLARLGAVTQVEGAVVDTALDLVAQLAQPFGRPGVRPHTQEVNRRRPKSEGGARRPNQTAREKFCRLRTCPTLRPELTSTHCGIFPNPREKQELNAKPKFQTPRPEGRLRPDDARTLRRHRLRAARRPGRPRR